MVQHYPLLALLEARQRAKESAELALGILISELELAERRELDLRARLDTAHQQLNARAREQLSAAQQGAVTALELQVADQHQRAVRIEIQRLAMELEDAAETTADRRGAVECGRERVVLSCQEFTIVERHHARFLESLAQTRNLRTDEQAAEVWEARRRVQDERLR